MESVEANWLALTGGTTFLLSVFLVLRSHRFNMRAFMKVTLFLIGLLLFAISLACLWLLFIYWSLSNDLNSDWM